MTDLLTRILNFIQSFIGAHGWSIVVFTIFVRFLLMPLDIKNRKGMRKMQKIQPELDKLQKKYANDKVKLQQKQTELMRRERYNPMSGCLPLLIQMPILFAMFAAMRHMANEQTIRQVFDYIQGNTPEFQGWLWVRNLWVPDSPFSPAAPSAESLRMIGYDVWQRVFQGLDSAAQSGILTNMSMLVENFSGTFDFSSAEVFNESLPLIQEALLNTPAYISSLATIPDLSNINFFIAKLSVYKEYNGLLILPILAGASQVLMTKFNPTTAQQQEGSNQAGGNFMKYFFPLFSVYICLTSNAAFALYWVVSNIIATTSTIAINAYFDRKDALATEAKER